MAASTRRVCVDARNRSKKKAFTNCIAERSPPFQQQDSLQALMLLLKIQCTDFLDSFDFFLQMLGKTDSSDIRTDGLFLAARALARRTSLPNHGLGDRISSPVNATQCSAQ